MTVDESKDAFVHILDVAGNRPVETFFQRVKCPKSGIVALSGDDLLSTNRSADVSCQVVSSPYMPREYRNNMLPETVDANHSGIVVLILYKRGNGSHTDAHSSDEDESIEFLPLFANIGALNCFSTKLFDERRGNFLPSLTDLYDGYLLHFRISIG